jgi:peptide/nickel transport system permease protein
MLSYIIRRVLNAIPILIAINVLTFLLFFFVNTPDDIAYLSIGEKNAKPQNVYKFKKEKKYHLPRLLNTKDTIHYFSSANNEFNDVMNKFSDYKFVTHTIEEKQVLKAKDIIDPNCVIIIEQKNANDNQVQHLFAKLLPIAVPYIVLQRSGEAIHKTFNDPSVISINITKDNPNSQLDELVKFVDTLQPKGLDTITQTIFFEKSVRLFWFDFGKSDNSHQDISSEVFERMGPSLLITVPTFFLGIFINIFISMLVAYCRGTYIDRTIMIICIINISILSLFYYFISQLVFGVWLKIVPVSGYLEGWSAIRFVMLPIFAALISEFGGGIRFYRTLFLEEINRDYVRTARSKGISEFAVLYKHVLKNALIPILTGVVIVLPSLFMGSLIIESFFSIPGLGGYTLDGIRSQDFSVVGSMVYLGSVLYIIGLVLTDISYTFVDPRVNLD